MRKKKGYSQQELAAIIGCSSSTIAGWENPNAPRRAQPSYYDALTNAFGVSIDEIIWISDNIKKVNLGEIDSSVLHTFCQKCQNCKHFYRYTDEDFGKCKRNNKIKWYSDKCMIEGGFSRKE